MASYAVKTLLFALLLVHATRGASLERPKRQQPPNQELVDNIFGTNPNESDDGDVPQRQNQPSTTAASSTTTTASPAYNSCIARCPITPEYNPVCGSNRQTYHNTNTMNCANRCGQRPRLTVLFLGTCSPL